MRAAGPLAAVAGAARARRGHVWTVRAVVLGLVVVAVALTLAWPATLLLRQSGELEQLSERETDLQASISRLDARRAALARPEVVEAEARARLGVARPEEDVFVVVDVGAAQERDARGEPWPGDVPRLSDSLLKRPDPDEPWWDRLLESPPAGGGRGAGEAPGPAATP